jgi:nucleoside-diphosphate-sugar epimerase
MKIAITGSTSGIGVYLNNRLQEMGFSTILLGGKTSEVWKLGQIVPKSIEADVLIHLAHDRSQSQDENVSAIEKICKTFSGRKINISSLSAHSNAISNYGKSKFYGEKIFTNFNGISLRCGVIYGANYYGGIYSQIEMLIRRIPFAIPVPYNGLSSMFTTHIDDLVNEIVDSLYSKRSGVIFSASPYPVSLYGLINQVLMKSAHRRILVSIPREPLNSIGKILIRIKPRLKMIDSLMSLSSEISKEELSSLLIPNTMFRDFNQI